MYAYYPLLLKKKKMSANEEQFDFSASEAYIDRRI